MDIEQIKIFCDLIETRSFSKTASRNLISQSAVSQLVKQLENKLRLELIDRTSRPFVPTQAGKIFFEYCKEIYEKYEQMHNRLAKFASELIGSVRIAGIPSLVLYFLQPYIRHYLQRHPNIKVYVEPVRANQALRMVQDDLADIALLAVESAGRRFTVEKICEEKMLVALPAEHPFVKRNKISIKSLELQPMILFERDQFTRRLVDKVFKKYDVTIRPVMELDSVETMKRAIEAGVGIGILPEYSIKQEVRTGSIVAKPITEEDIVRPICVLYRRKGKALNEASKRFIELLSIDREKVESSG